MMKTRKTAKRLQNRDEWGMDDVDIYEVVEPVAYTWVVDDAARAYVDGSVYFKADVDLCTDPTVRAKLGIDGSFKSWAICDGFVYAASWPEAKEFLTALVAVLTGCWEYQGGDHGKTS